MDFALFLSTYMYLYTKLGKLHMLQFTHSSVKAMQLNRNTLWHVLVWSVLKMEDATPQSWQSETKGGFAPEKRGLMGRIAALEQNPVFNYHRALSANCSVLALESSLRKEDGLDWIRARSKAQRPHMQEDGK